MRIYNFILFLLILCTLEFTTISIKANDSIPPRTLKDVVVEHQREWIDDGKVNFIPTRREKRMSDSPSSLVETMHIPILNVKDGTIINLRGDEVPIFINGEKADDIDLSTFWPQEVKLVQYIEHPVESNYRGIPSVINFVVDKYEYGGVTRGKMFQRVPNNGSYEAASKFAYGKMTYGAKTCFRYTRDHYADSWVQSAYRDIYYEHHHYDEITRLQTTHQVKRTNTYQISVNAKYATDKFIAVHTLALGWKINPGSRITSTDEWNKDLFGIGTSASYLTSRSFSPMLSGDYFNRISEKLAITGRWLYSYSHNHDYNSNVMGSNAPICNWVSENVSSINASLTPTYRHSDVWSFQLKLSASLDWFSSMYAGSTDASQRQTRQEYTASAVINWAPFRKMNLRFEPGVLTTSWRIGHVKKTYTYPTVNASLDWAPNRGFSWYGSLKFALRPTSAFESNPVMVRNSELLWTMGNPYLKNSKYWDSYTYLTLLPNGWLSLALGAGYTRINNEVIHTFEAASPEQGGIVKQMINAHPSDNVRLSLDLSTSFLDNDLTIVIAPEWHYSKVRGTSSQDLYHLSFTSNVDYLLRNCKFGLAYVGPSKILGAGGMEKTWLQASWDFSFVYSTGSLYLKFMVENIFNGRRKGWTKYQSSNFSSVSHTRSKGRATCISLTYTFGYGKRLNRAIDIDTPSDTKSSIMNFNK